MIQLYEIHHRAESQKKATLINLPTFHNLSPISESTPQEPIRPSTIYSSSKGMENGQIAPSKVFDGSIKGLEKKNTLVSKIMLQKNSMWKKAYVGHALKTF